MPRTPIKRNPVELRASNGRTHCSWCRMQFRMSFKKNPDQDAITKIPKGERCVVMVTSHRPQEIFLHVDCAALMAESLSHACGA